MMPANWFRERKCRCGIYLTSSAGGTPMKIGDRVSLTATIRKLVLDRASITIPSFNQPFSIISRKGMKAGGSITLTGEVTRVDEGDVTIELDDGGLITVKDDVLTLIKKGKQETFGGRDWER
jgi:hypothetical protein